MAEPTPDDVEWMMATIERRVRQDWKDRRANATEANEILWLLAQLDAARAALRRIAEDEAFGGRCWHCVVAREALAGKETT